VRTPLWFDRAFSSNVYYEATHALVSCLVSPQESKNPVIKITMFSVIKINDIVLNSKPPLFNFAAVFWCNLIFFACCCNTCMCKWHVHNKRYFAIPLKALKTRIYVLYGFYPIFFSNSENSLLIRTFMNDTLSSECHKLKRKHMSWPVPRANGTHLVFNILLTVASE